MFPVRGIGTAGVGRARRLDIDAGAIGQTFEVGSQRCNPLGDISVGPARRGEEGLLVSCSALMPLYSKG